MTPIQIRLFDFLYEYACLFLGLFIFMTAIAAAGKITWSKWIQNLFDKSDKLAYDIYLVHMIFVKGCLSLIGLLGNTFIESILILLFSAAAGSLLHIVSLTVSKGLDKHLLKRLSFEKGGTFGTKREKIN